MNKKHTLSIVGFVFSVISVFFSIILVLITAKSHYSDTKNYVFIELALYTATPGIICSIVAKLKKDISAFSTVGVATGIISIVLIFSAITVSILPYHR